MTVAPWENLKTILKIKVSGDEQQSSAQVALIGFAGDNIGIHQNATMKTAVARLEATVENPRLWWTPELGEPARYMCSQSP